jgi:outer membrane biosynthesis protein TonB
VPKNEDGEFELVLGNRQLLSMFFVVVVLLGVFFVMGYIVGRNSAPLVSGEPSTARKADTKPLVVDSPAPKQPSAPETVTPPSPDASKPAETAVAKAPETKPELPRTEPPKPEPAKSEPIKPSTSRSEPAAPKREAAKEREAAKAEKPRPAAPSNPAQSNAPAAGQTYLQLVATTKHDADATVEVLRKNSFPALDTEVPEKPGLFRVLVGPLAPGDVNKMKAALQGKGFPGDAAIRKTY